MKLKIGLFAMCLSRFVLIEPYWNVDKKGKSISYHFNPVLIEPYWNTK